MNVCIVWSTEVIIAYMYRYIYYAIALKHTDSWKLIFCNCSNRPPAICLFVTTSNKVLLEIHLTLHILAGDKSSLFFS